MKNKICLLFNLVFNPSSSYSRTTSIFRNCIKSSWYFVLYWRVSIVFNFIMSIKSRIWFIFFITINTLPCCGILVYHVVRVIIFIFLLSSSSSLLYTASISFIFFLHRLRLVMRPFVFLSTLHFFQAYSIIGERFLFNY